MDKRYNPEHQKQFGKLWGPLVAAMDAYNDWFWPIGVQAALSMPGSYVAEENGKIGGVNHGVIIVGYHDDAIMTEGGYWIVKNSWGAGWGDVGYGYILYGDVEQYNRVHAITGDAYAVIPEPATILVTINGIFFIFASPRKRKFTCK